MANSGLHGPHSLTDQGIDAIFQRTGPGAYALGRNSPDGKTFFVSYVGRSDSDLKARLKQWSGKYQHFKYGLFPSPLAAFQKECHLFHDFGEATLDNKVHPARPQGSNWNCPCCTTFD